MNTGKVVANAGSHRILYALSFGACTSKELKNIVGAINSVARFDGEYMARLISNGYARRDGETWYITKPGRDKLEQLGPAKGLRPRGSYPTRAQSLMALPAYNPSSHIPPPMRPGSEEFLKHPSRMGNKLYYRDGRIVNIGENHGN